VNAPNKGWKPLPLSDDTWKRFAGPVGLPDSARPAFEDILGYGKFLTKLDSTSTPPNATRMSLQQTRRKAEALRRDLCAGGADALMAMISPEGMEEDGPIWMPPPRLTRFRSLEEHIERLDLLIKWIDDAVRQLPRAKPGDKTMATRAITSQIDKLLRCCSKNQRLTPGAKESNPGRDFLAECFKLLKIETSAISAIRRLASERNAAKLLREKD
jgi:hypothetical protein